jgi:hypothetical protein
VRESAVGAPLENLRRWLFLSGVVYAVAGLGFLFAADPLLAMIDAVSLRLIPSLPPIAASASTMALTTAMTTALTPGTAAAAGSPERFWLVLAGAMMATIAACGIYGAARIARRFEMAVPIVVSKLTSTILGVSFFVGSAPHLAYLVIAATDLPLGIITWILYRRAARAVSAS